MRVQIVAEIGINCFYGSDRSKFLNNAKRLIDIAAVAGCDVVKFQKRTPTICVPEKHKNREKIVPWRSKPTTYLQYKEDIEFGFQDYMKLIRYALDRDIELFASVWDIKSAMFMTKFTDTVKVPSAKLTNWKLLEFCRDNFAKRIISTGMSVEDEIEKAVSILDPHVIFHTNSVYPTPVGDLNLGYIEWLREKYPDREIGLSSHYYGIVPAIASILLKASWIEFHITECHDYWGSDQKSSVEPSGVFKLVKGIRDLEKANIGKEDRKLYPGEIAKREILRGE